MNHHLFKNKNTHVGWQKSRLESTKERIDDDKLKKVFLDNFIKNLLFCKEKQRCKAIAAERVEKKIFLKMCYILACLNIN